MLQFKKLVRLGLILGVLVVFFGLINLSQPLEVQSQSGIVVDHTSVDLFDDIPEQYIQAAANLRMLFIDRSVGGNISDALDCLNYPSDEVAPSSCKRYEHVVPAFSADPSEVNWSRVGGYERQNWDYLYWDDTLDCGTWSQKVGCFFEMVNPVISQYDVVSYQFSYLEVDQGSSIADQPGGFFWNNPTLQDVYDLEAYEAQHSDKLFIYWTTSLARSIGTTTSESFNDQMRQYALANNKVLFDVADILSHDPTGNPCYDNRDSVPYDNGNNFENHPDDGQNIPAICQHYTTETEGGHLGSVSTGGIRVAKAFWVLMAQLAGWTPSGHTPPPPLDLHGRSADQAIHLSWRVNTTLPSTATWRIDYTGGPTGDQLPPITNLPNSTRQYSLTGLPNYIWYSITLNAMLDGSPILTDTANAMATDRLVFLPIVLKTAN